MLNFLADDEDGEVVWTVAGNPHTSKATLRRLSLRVEDGLLQSSLSQNESAPPDVLAKLASHPDRLVRSGVAMNRGTALHLLDQLARDDDLPTRQLARKALLLHGLGH